MDSESKQRIVFFDGVCGLCNSYVDFLLPRDSEKKLQFSPLQSEAAKQYLSEQLRADLSTVVFFDEGLIFVRSEAVLRAMSYLPWPWNSMRFFRLIPAFLRDAIYRLVAKTRYGLFGKKESCRLPTPDERERFI